MDSLSSSARTEVFFDMHDITTLIYLHANIHSDVEQACFFFSPSFALLAALLISSTHASCFAALSSVADRLPRALGFLFIPLCDCVFESRNNTGVQGQVGTVWRGGVCSAQGLLRVSRCMERTFLICCFVD